MRSNRPSLLRLGNRMFLHLLLLAALFQGLLPMLMRPSLVQTSTGETVFLCTLQGLHAIQMANGDEGSAAAANVCPACLLSQAGAAPLAHNLPAPVVVASQPGYLLPEQHDFPLPPRYFLTASPRAPPLA